MFALPPDLRPGTGDQVSVWAAIRAAEELEQLLVDVIDYRRRGADAGPDGTYEERRRRAHEDAASLRGVLDDDQPITFGGDAPADTGGHDV